MNVFHAFNGTFYIIRPLSYVEAECTGKINI